MYHPVQLLNLIKYKKKKKIICKNGKIKLKHTTLCYDNENRELKSEDIFSKITSLQCSWVERLCENSFHAWKGLALFLIKNYLRKKFLFDCNLIIKQKVVKRFPNFIKKF